METAKRHRCILSAKRLIGKLSVAFLLLLMLAFILLWIGFQGLSQPNGYDDPAMDIYTMSYDVSQLDDSEESKIIKLGYEVFRNTSKYIGPANTDKNMAYAGNNLSCTNCHLWSGTKPYAAPLIGIKQRFPQFRGRENKVGTIEERINGCMERSMNGRMLPPNAQEMKVLVAYLNWLSRFAPEDGKIKGQGLMKIEIPDRAVDLEKGKLHFETHCVLCHGKNGQGKISTAGSFYEYPPLWGNDSYNNGAGMTRVITAAQFIKGNMPYGTTYDNPVLTDEEAYDVAGFINQKPRPEKTNLAKDFPDLIKKPVSSPYPPYADTFSVIQHQLGPFKPIMEYYKTAYDIDKSK